MSVNPPAGQRCIDDYTQPSLIRPKTSQKPSLSRVFAREWYWSHYDYDSYECPDCGRGKDRVYEFDVHHIDEDPTNNDPDNLVAVCHRCHIWRHHSPTLSGLDVIEWQQEFLEEVPGQSTKRNTVYDQQKVTQ